MIAGALKDEPRCFVVSFILFLSSVNEDDDATLLANVAICYLFSKTVQRMKNH